MTAAPGSPVYRSVVVMGVSGSGKSTVGAALADAVGWEFVDADSLHSREARESMADGVPLTDSDRQPWLSRIGDVLRDSKRVDLVLACSALKKRYRDELRRADPDIVFVYLRGTADRITQRLDARNEHFVTTELLASQMETLEEPEHALAIDIDGDVPTIVRTITDSLGI